MWSVVEETRLDHLVYVVTCETETDTIGILFEHPAKAEKVCRILNEAKAVPVALDDTSEWDEDDIEDEEIEDEKHAHGRDAAGRFTKDE